MEIRVLGAHNRESATTRPLCLLVDGRLAVDAGALSARLTLEEQATVGAILITHHHLDHIKDLPMIAFNALGKRAIDVYTSPESRDAINATILNPEIWLPLFDFPPDAPTLRFHAVCAYAPFEALDYRITPVPSHHKKNPHGFMVEGGGRSFLYTSDTGAGLAEAMRDLRPDLLITEVTLPNAMAELAVEAQHLTPRFLQTEIEALKRRGGPLPRLLVVHVDPRHEATIRREIDEVAQATGAVIDLAQEEQRLRV